jgi:tRNA pseudouridine55 synthase
MPRSSRRVEGTGLDGVLVLAKPPGPTSHDLVALVRRLSGTRRVGHGGTLDPFATGVLPIFLGHATRVAEFHLGAAKRYTATICFGAGSTTDDLEGELTPAPGPGPDREGVEAALERFVGPIVQRPPAFSARRVGGRRAYALARKGLEPVLEPREVTIESIELLEWDAADPERPIAIVDVRCSAGTYLRALGRDVGAAVGNAAYLGALTRTESGPFLLADAISLDTLRGAASDGTDAVRALLRPIDAGLDHLPVLRLAPDEVTAIARGQLLHPSGLAAGSDPLRLVDENGALVAIGRWRGSSIVPDKVLIDVDASRGNRETSSGPSLEPERDA